MQKFIPSFILKTLGSTLTVAILLTACSSSSTRMMGDTTSLEGLQSMGKVQTSSRTRKNSGASSGRIREMALSETALSLGAQSGLAWRAKAIDEELTCHTKYLNTVYNFNALLLDHNILPPVLLEGRNTLNLADPQTIRVSDRVYRIAKQARFITTPPTWRQYLWMDYTKPERPHSSLLPQTREERQIWATCVERGWRNGVEQANIILEENLARIKEDFNGMIRYRKLLAMNMISPPYVSHTELGITGDSSEMRIDDQVLRITALPELNVRSEQWRAAVAKDENALEKFRQMEKDVQNARITITSNAWQPVIAPVNDR